jgi:hypothetical protein
MLFHFFGRYDRIISLLSCFAGGVFMGTGLLDLLPEVNELLSKVLLFIHVDYGGFFSSLPFQVGTQMEE